MVLLNTSQNATNASTFHMFYATLHPAHPYRDLSTSYEHAFVSLCVLIAVIALIGNSILFYVIVSKKNLRTPTNLFLLSLVVADTLTAVLLIPIYVERFMNHGLTQSNQTVCLLRKYLFILTSSASLMSLAAVSLDRMFAISYPFSYARKVNRKNTSVVILVMWIWVIAFNSVTFHNFEDWDNFLITCSSGMPRTLYTLVTPINFYLPGVIIIVAYIKIFHVAHAHNVRINTQTRPRSDTSQTIFTASPAIIHRTRTISELTTESCTTAYTPTSSPYTSRSRSTTILSNKIHEGREKLRKVTQTLSRDIKTVKTVGILIGLFLFCWLPIACYYMYVNITGKELETTPRYGYMYDIFTLLSFLNSAINPYLYTFRNKELKREIYALIKKFFTIS